MHLFNTNHFLEFQARPYYKYQYGVNDHYTGNFSRFLELTNINSALTMILAHATLIRFAFIHQKMV
jgi:hypothetical protein